MADGNPFQSILNPNARQTNLWDLRMMAAANRMEAPFERGMGRTGARGGLGGNPMLAGMGGMSNEPDYSSFTYDPAMRQRAIEAGVTPLEASQVRQNVLLPNTGFFGRHPRLSGALEGALFGAAATPSSGGVSGVGEGIANAIEGGIGGTRIRQGMQRQQFARPFEAAESLERLADMKQRRQLQDADIQHLRAVNEHLVRGDDEKAQQLIETNRHAEAMEGYRNTQIESTAPRNLGEGRIGVYHPENVPPEGKPIDPAKPLWEVQQDPEWQKQYNEDRRLGRLAANAANAIDTRTGKYVRMQPGDDARFIKPISALESGTRIAQGHKDKWIQHAMDDPATSHRLLRNDPNYKNIIKSPEMTKQALEKFYDENDLGGADTDYVYTPGTGIVPARP